MIYSYIWANADPRLREHLRRADEARAAAVYGAWRALVRAVADPLRRWTEQLRRQRRARASYDELSALSDDALRDIGLSRGELLGVAETIAERESDDGLTVAEYRAASDREAAREASRVAPLPRVDDRRRRLAPSTVAGAGGARGAAQADAPGRR